MSMKRYLFTIFFCLILFNQTSFSAGFDDSRSKRASTTSKGQTVHSGCESGCFEDTCVKVGDADDQPQESVATVPEGYAEYPPTQRAREISAEPQPIIESSSEAPRSTPSYKMMPITVSAEPCEPVCLEPQCFPCEPCDPTPSYSTPSWAKYVLPVAVAGSALAVSAVRATDSCEDPDPSTRQPILTFFVEASLGGFNGEGNEPGSITVEILFPDNSVLDTFTLSVGSTAVPIILSQLSNATRNYESGVQFTVNATSVNDRVDSITVDGRLDGVDFDSQSQNFPSPGLLFTFTIP